MCRKPSLLIAIVIALVLAPGITATSARWITAGGEHFSGGLALAQSLQLAASATGTIAFNSRRDGNAEIYVMNADGSGQTRVTNHPANDYDPTWSPDGTRLAFTSYRDGNEETYVMNRDGSGQANLNHHPANDFSPAWSPDGTRIAFTSMRDGHTEIYVMNADGSAQTRLTFNSLDVGVATWSPDSARIAFHSYHAGNYELFVMNADGSGQTQLTYSFAGNQLPAWSPDGTRIAFDSSRDGNVEIYVMNADGSGQTRLTNNPAQDWGPTWSLDGTQIAFVSNRDGNFEIYKMNADGSGQTRLTNNTGEDTNPSWGAARAAVKPFLDLPFSYTNFAEAANGNTGTSPGCVNSWFDHTYPTYELPPNAGTNNITTWSDATYPITPAMTIGDFRKGKGIWWYDGHNGIDFRQEAANELVRAAAAGTVISTTTNPVVTSCKEGKEKVRSCGNYYGNQVWLDHHNSYATLYGHLRSISATVGSTVTVAQSLGIMGDTGNSDGTHLHFGLYYDQNGDGRWTQNEVVDPYGWSGKRADPWSMASQYLWQKLLSEQKEAGSSGATLTSPSGHVQTTIPSGALTSTVTVELWDAPPVAEPSGQLRSLGHSFWLRILEWLTGSSVGIDAQASTASFARPVTVTVAYSDAEMRHHDETQMALYWWAEGSGTWIGLPTTVDVGQNQAVAQSSEPGRFDLQAPLVCAADTEEPNDDYYSASLLTLEGGPQRQLFDGAQDEDWFRLETARGAKYTLATGNLAAGVDTLLQVYEMNGLTLLAADDNSAGNGASRLDWYAPAAGTYFVRVTQAPGSASGCDATYDISVREEFTVYLPLVRG